MCIRDSPKWEDISGLSWWSSLSDSLYLDSIMGHDTHLLRTFYSIEKDIAKLADILGHSSIDTTRIYIMTTGAEHRRKIERMGLVI